MHAPTFADSMTPGQPVPWRGRSRLAVIGAVLLLALAGLVGLTTPAQSAPADHSDGLVFTIPTPTSPPSIVGTSHLVRTDSGVSITLETSGLEPGHPVTLWAIVANSPDQCVAGLPGLSQCGPADHVSGRGDMSVHNVAGRIARRDGTASYGAHLRVGDTSRVLFEDEPGLTDARAAEVILVLKTHGPKIPGLTNEMLSTFAGGCAEAPFAPTLEPREEMIGTPGPNDCAEIQVTVHDP